MNYIYGLNAVSEAIKVRGRAFQWVGLAKERHDLRLQRIIEECHQLKGAALLRGARGRPAVDVEALADVALLDRKSVV